LGYIDHMERILTAPLWILVAGVLVVGVVLAVALLSQADRRWREVLSLWLARNHYRLESADYRVLRLGPFTWTSRRGHAVFYIALTQEDGVKRRGWIRLSDPFCGSVDGRVEVRWES
jgi:hypothetical protein